MHISELRERLEATPFVPFRVHVSDGSSYEVNHPEFALLAKWAIHVGIEEDEEDHVPNRIIRIAISHISRIEEIDPGVGAMK